MPSLSHLRTSLVIPPAFIHATPGLALGCAIATSALWLAQQPWFARHGLGALTLAIVAGLLLGNTVYPRLARSCGPGVALAKQQLLRAGIVLYGLRLTFQDIAQVGWSGVATDALVLASTFGLACWLGQRVLGLDRRTTLLIGAGSSICGAAAVLATAPVAKGRAQDVAVAIATVVVFGTLGTFLYPALFQWNAEHGWLHTDAQHYGLYVGATVHEVAQVVAAGTAVGPEAASTAVIAKMVRVMMLAPFLVGLSALLARGRRDRQGPRSRIAVPWFAFGFIAMVGFIHQDTDAFLRNLHHTPRDGEILHFVTIFLESNRDNAALCHRHKRLVARKHRYFAINRRDGRRIHLLVELDARKGNQLKFHHASFFFAALASAAT